MGRDKPRLPTEEDILTWFSSLSNWGRWGADDEMGTLNLITDDARVRAARLVREGFRVSCSWDISQNKDDPVHLWMHRTGQGLTDGHRVMQDYSESHGSGDRFVDAVEYVGMMFHGLGITHIDALSHIFWDGRMYNGRPAELVTSHLGATANSICAARDGVFTRGILLDVARSRAVDWLEPGEAVLPEDLEYAEEQSGVRVGEGDALLVRTGEGRRRRQLGRPDFDRDGQAGLHAATLPWLRERGVALVGCDTATEVVPSGYSQVPLPLHIVGIVAMGLWEVDNLDLEGAASTCAERDRWDFLFTLDPLRIVGATGSPVNAVATF